MNALYSEEAPKRLFSWASSKERFLTRGGGVYRTGRNQHFGIKATAETVERFYKAADDRGRSARELLKLALDALDRAGVSR